MNLAHPSSTENASKLIIKILKHQKSPIKILTRKLTSSAIRTSLQIGKQLGRILLWVEKQQKQNKNNNRTFFKTIIKSKIIL
jgi:hypothetical protein